MIKISYLFLVIKIAYKDVDVKRIQPEIFGLNVYRICGSLRHRFNEDVSSAFSIRTIRPRKNGLIFYILVKTKIKFVPISYLVQHALDKVTLPSTEPYYPQITG